MAESSRELLRSRRLLPLFLTQLQGAFSANLFKSATLIVLVFGDGQSRPSGELLANLASAAFILPFFVLSALAGQLADKFDKTRLIRLCKAAELAIAVLAAIALWSDSTLALMLVLLLFGTQAAMFGPVKFAILPAHLRQDELIGGNAALEGGTFIAILLGTLLGAALAGNERAAPWLGLLLVAASAFGLLASLRIPPAPAAAPDLPLTWNPLVETRAAVQLAAARPAVLLAILGISWFWLIGSAYLTQVPSFVHTHLHAGSGVVALLLGCFAIGIAAGSLVCERLSGGHIEIGLVPIGSTGLSLFALDACLQTFDNIGAGAGWASFLLSADGSRLCADFLMIGAFGGMFVVPLNALIQARTPAAQRARIIALNNVLNAAFMTVAAAFAAFMLGVVDIGINELFIVLALMNLAVAWFIYHQVPEFSARFMIWLLTHTMYRVRHEGLEQVPDRGAAIIVCNHVSFVDALLLAGAVRRPIRFIMYKPIYEIPLLNFIFRAGRAIPIAARKEDPQAFEQAFAQIREGLLDGDLLAIFPEGKLTTDGEIDVFRSGIERILDATPVPVLPMALRGLWGSWFSPEGGGAFAKRPKRFWSKVELVAGERIDPRGVDAAALRTRVQQLRGAHR